jgi:hypothetical protein
MTDNDARGLVLRRLYELRDEKEWLYPNDFGNLPLSPNQTTRILGQLVEHSLIHWKPHKSGRADGIDTFRAKIGASGSDVLEGTAPAPLAINFDQSINIQGSQGVMIGGSGNVQNVNIDVEHMLTAIDRSTASQAEREKAKSIINQISESKLVRDVLASWVKKLFSGS